MAQNVLFDDLDTLTAPFGAALDAHLGDVPRSRPNLLAGVSFGHGTPLLDDLLAGVGTGQRPDLLAGTTTGGSADLFGGTTVGGSANLWAGVGFGGATPGGGGGNILGNLFSGLGTAAHNLWEGVSPFNTNKPTPAAAPSTTPGSTAGGGPSAGMSPGVAKWAGQAQQTFGGLIDPDVMLAIMTNESGGDPNAYNSAGDAYGLFQQVGLGSNDPNTQFAAARKLAEEKLAGVNAAYAAHGLNPDERTRARDFALAWAGHFDYDTGLPNPNSRDVGSGQTAQQLGDIFLANYDRIKAGRQQAGAGSVPISAEGFAFPVVGYSQPVQLHWGSEEGGSDLMAAEGTPIVSMGAGTITDVSPNSLGGNTVTMKLDNGLIVYMAHLRDAPLVAAGQRVAAGAPLGYVGTTGNAAGGPAHLHIGIGYDIQAGSGPTGGLGTGFNAVDWLNQILNQTRGNTGGGGASYR
jgi:murein DD-endopeptidase MepM/ murein hydrolase activator NlpD